VAERRHVVLLLAAGGSRRLGRPKQLLEFDQQPLIRRMALTALATHPAELIVALGAEVDGCRHALKGLAWRECQVPDWRQGMGASLSHALRDADPEAAILVLGVDQPALEATHLQALLQWGRTHPDHAIASGYAATLGIPALFPPSWRPALLTLDGDNGARALLRAAGAAVLGVDAPQLAFDIDSPGDLL
jgi:molybdenum cofactor cytidylyltransferase